jgi:N,N'-diacetyllegionaminate synthase
MFITSKHIFIIAEAGVNHNGRLHLAKKLVDAAAKAGADAVKFQTFNAERLTTASAPKAQYQKKSGAAESQRQMLKRLELSESDHKSLMNYCRQKGIMFLSTPFDEQSADFLEKLGVKAFKIPSGELTNLPFIKHVASKGKPMILSTGMADLDEVKQAVKAAGKAKIVLLHCVSSYPAAVCDVNLKAMDTLAKTFHVPVGYSDHTLGIDVAVAAAARGAQVIEKHLTLDKTMPGPDHRASAEPQELTALIKAVRNVEAALGDGIKRPAACEKDIARVARKSLVAACDISKGVIIKTEMIIIKRPGSGLSPALKSKVIGRKAKNLISKDTLIRLGDLS